MQLKQISKWVMVTGTLIIWIVKFMIRPLQLFDDPTRFILNVLPNLLGSFLIPFGAYWFFSGRNNFIARIFKLETVYELRMVCLLGFAMLIINEYLQRINFFGRTFDLFDILFSAIGLLSSYFVFGRLQQKTYLPAG